jgi:deferrochelatase/peroxidase EfeB
MKVDFSEVQGIIRTYRRVTSRHLIFRFDSGRGARAFIRELAERITMADGDPNSAPDPLLNVGMTFNGLQALEVDQAMLGEFDAVFRLGPPTVKMALGDVPGSRSDPANWWENRFATDDVHCLVHLYAQSDDAAADAVQAVRQLADSTGVTELIPRRDGTILSGRWFAVRKMHFGYTDGISQPDIFWDDETPPRSPEQIDFRNFLLGYSTDKYASAPSSGAAADFARNSTYGLFRWIYQDVAAFNQFLAVQGPELFPELPAADAEELLAAKMMGRWRDGTPLVLSPERPDPQLAKKQ